MEFSKVLFFSKASASSPSLLIRTICQSARAVNFSHEDTCVVLKDSSLISSAFVSVFQAICTEAGLMALRERRMKVTNEDFKKSKENVLYKKQEGTPEGLYL